MHTCCVTGLQVLGLQLYANEREWPWASVIIPVCGELFQTTEQDDRMIVEKRLDKKSLMQIERQQFGQNKWGKQFNLKPRGICGEYVWRAGVVRRRLYQTDRENWCSRKQSLNPVV